jgi:hypothetical protein
MVMRAGLQHRRDRLRAIGRPRAGVRFAGLAPPHEYHVNAHLAKYPRLHVHFMPIQRSWLDLVES